MTRVELDLEVERHNEKLPRYVTIPRAALAKHGVGDRVLVSGTLGGVPFEGRNVHPWDDERFFMNLPQALCRKAGVDVGDRVTLSLVLPARA